MIRNYLFIVFLLWSCISGTVKNKPPEDLFRYWIHSYEDDKDYRAYRPENYNFPRSRTRAALEILPDGKIYEYTIAPTDGLLKIEGTWKQIDDKNYIFTYKDKQLPTKKIEVIELSKDILKIKITFFEKDN